MSLLMHGKRRQGNVCMETINRGSTYYIPEAKGPSSNYTYSYQPSKPREVDPPFQMISTKGFTQNCLMIRY